jgi:hypothetical protein
MRLGVTENQKSEGIGSYGSYRSTAKIQNSVLGVACLY